MQQVSVIIPTYDRLADLTVCIRSILQQTRLPNELIIVDDGNLAAIPLATDCERQGIRVIYHKKSQPGLTASRNIGIKMAGGDIIFFLDDDVELFDDYIANTLKVFEQNSQTQLMGVGGVIANEPALSRAKRVRRLLDRLFLVTGPSEGKVLASGFCVNFGATGREFDGLTGVDFLAGGVCAYRKQVFKEHLFDESYLGYGLGEDKDFSFRLSRKFQLAVTPQARLNHYESPVMRYNKQKLGEQFILSRYKFFRDHVYRNNWSLIPFYYAVFGYTLGRLIILLLTLDASELARIRGIFRAIGKIVSGRSGSELQG